MPSFIKDSLILRESLRKLGEHIELSEYIHRNLPQGNIPYKCPIMCSEAKLFLEAIQNIEEIPLSASKIRALLNALPRKYVFSKGFTYMVGDMQVSCSLLAIAIKELERYNHPAAVTTIWNWMTIEERITYYTELNVTPNLFRLTGTFALLTTAFKVMAKSGLSNPEIKALLDGASLIPNFILSLRGLEKLAMPGDDTGAACATGSSPHIETSGAAGAAAAAQLAPTLAPMKEGIKLNLLLAMLHANGIRSADPANAKFFSSTYLDAFFDPFDSMPEPNASQIEKICITQANFLIRIALANEDIPFFRTMLASSHRNQILSMVTSGGVRVRDSVTAMAEKYWVKLNAQTIFAASFKLPDQTAGEPQALNSVTL